MGPRSSAVGVRLECSHVGCCDQSPRKQAPRRFHGTKHPIVRSFEPGEDRGWCCVDEVAFQPAPTPQRIRRTTMNPHSGPQAGA